MRILISALKFKTMSENNAKTILITGGAGFIGSHLVKRLVDEEHKVHLLIKKSTDIWRIKDVLKKVELHYENLLDKKSLLEVVKKINPNGVFHLAASNIASGVTASDEEVLRVNILGFKNLVDSLQEIDYEFFVNTGSFMEYGPKGGAVKESDLCAPTELYSISKLGATLYGQAIAKKYDKPIVTFRMFTPYGPALQSGRLVYEVVNRALKNETIEVTNREIARDFIFVEDIVSLYIECMDKAKKSKGEVFNAGSGKTVKLDELVEYIINKTNSKSVVKWGERPLLAYDSKLWQADMEKTFGNFTWRPGHTFEQGLNKTIEYYQK